MKTHTTDEIRLALRKAMDEAMITRDDVSNLLRVNSQYVNFLYSKSYVHRVPDYFLRMLSEWMDSGVELVEWFMSKCDFKKYETFRQPGRGKVNMKPAKPKSAALVSKEKEAREKRVFVAKTEEQRCERTNDKKVDWSYTENPDDRDLTTSFTDGENPIPLTNFLNELRSRGIHAEITVKFTI